MASPRLFQLRVPARPESLFLVAGLIDGVASRLRFPPKEVHRLHLLAEEMCSNVCKFAYRPSEDGELIVEGELQLGCLIIRVLDHGMPFDPLHVPTYDPANPESRGLGMFLVKKFADEVRYRNLGREGKAFEVAKRLPGSSLEKLAQENSPAESANEEAPIDPSEIEIRLLRAEDAPRVARCAYRVYGYSYLGEHLYEPERLLQMVEQGELVSAVAASCATGEIFGHTALIFSHKSVIAEVGQAFVMANVRGGGLFKKLKTFLMDIARERGLPGVYSESVTVHPFTQKANLALQAKECGMLLGYIPAELDFKGIAKLAADRQTAVLFYNLLGEPSAHSVYVPPHHRSIVLDIYAHAGIPLEELPATAPEPERSHAQFCLSISNQWGIAFIAVEEYGADLVETLHRSQHRLRLGGVSVIFLDLPMDRPYLISALPQIEMLGFGFAGVIPGFFGETDSLRLQYLNNVAIDVSRVKLESEFAKRLFDYALSHQSEYLGDLP